MPLVGLFLVVVVLGFVVDLIAAWFVWLIAPHTGIEAIGALTYWNSFFVVLLGNVIVAPAVGAASK